MVFCNMNYEFANLKKELVTILILIDGFLQFSYEYQKKMQSQGHNPYFNRWFSAISKNSGV